MSKLYFKLCAFILILWLQAEMSSALSCYKCEGTADCAKDMTDANKVNCTEGTKCYTKIEPNKVTRGCLLEKDTATCVADKCETCDKDNCNKAAIRQCKVCNSTKDEDCITGKNVKFDQYCSLGQKVCINYIDDKRNTIRSCAKDEEECKTKSNCTAYPIGEQNDGLYPLGRLLCYKCKNCYNVGKDTPEACTNYEAENKCYSTGVERGCLNDARAPKNCTIENSCETCANNACNNKTYKIIKCVQCKNCSDAQKPEDAKDCKPNITADNNNNNNNNKQQPECYIQEFNGTVERGCFSERNQAWGECIEANDCQHCAANGCNTQASGSLNFKCIRCRSDLNPKCSDKANELHGETCEAVNEADAFQNGCFTGRWAGVTIRGCAINLNQSCTREAQCELCQGANCNLKNQASAMRMSFIIIFILTAVLFISAK